MVGYIQEQREDFERRSETTNQINSSQYISQETLVPIKQKVLRSRVPEVSKNRVKTRGNRTVGGNMDSQTLTSSETAPAGLVFGNTQSASSPYLGAGRGEAYAQNLGGLILGSTQS